MVFPKFKIFSFGNRISTLVFIVGVAGTMFIVSFTSSFVLYILIYGLFYGLFIGFGYISPLANCIEHIPDKKGLCSGICVMGSGFGALFFNVILLQCINPENLPFDEETQRFPK
jgi:hypothetical protein